LNGWQKEKPRCGDIQNNPADMETKPIVRKLTAGLWIIAGLFVGLIVVSWFVDYPKWLEQLMHRILMISLGIVLLYKAYQIRNTDPRFAWIYVVVAAILIVVSFIRFADLQIILVIGLAVFLLSDRRVRKIINNRKEIENP
jgi:di/tricarboxylate transporter